MAGKTACAAEYFISETRERGREERERETLLKALGKFVATDCPVLSVNLLKKEAEKFNHEHHGGLQLTEDSPKGIANPSSENME